MSYRIYLAAVLSLALVAGCIDYQESIVVDSDGRVEITVFATVARGGLKLVENRPELQQLLLLPPNPILARELLPDTVQVKHWVIREGPGVRIYDLAVTLTSLEDAQVELGALSGSDSVRIYRDGDAIVYRRRVPAVPLETRIARSRLEESLSNSRLEFSLTVPTEILETNGIRPTPQHAIWRTNLLALRQHGLEMVARIRPPRPLALWAAVAAAMMAVAAASVVGVAVWRRRRFDSAPPIE